MNNNITTNNKFHFGDALSLSKHRISRIGIGICWGLLIVLILSACNNEDAEYVDIDYKTFTITFTYPDNWKNIYDVYFDGFPMIGSAGLVTTTAYYNLNNPTGLLEVFTETDSITPGFKTQLTNISENDTVLLIGINNEVFIYSPDEFPAFTVNVIYLSGQSDLYNTIFTSGDYTQNIISGTNYISEAQSNGTLQIAHKSDNAAVFTKTLTITDGTRVDFLQLDEDKFIDATISDNEAAPVDKNHTKIRFYLDPKIDANGEEVEMLIYDTSSTVVATLNFNPATSTSPFAEINITETYKYEVYRKSDMKKLVSKRTIKHQSDGVYKFQTLKASKYYSTFMEDLSVEW